MTRGSELLGHGGNLLLGLMRPRYWMRRGILAGRGTQGQTAKARRSLPIQRHNRRTATTARPVASPIHTPTAPSGVKKAQREADRRANRPIAEKRDDKGPLGIVQAAQHVGEDALACVEDLEDGRHLEQRDGDRDCARILRRVDIDEGRDQEPRRDDHRGCGQDRVEKREAEGAPAGAGDRPGVAAPHRQGRP